MVNLPLDRRLSSLEETLVMTGVSGAISFALGLPLGLILVGASPGGLWENRWVNRIVGAIVNSFRSLPFIILLVALIPVTRLIVGTSIGTAAAIVETSVMIAMIVVLIALVALIQAGGDLLARLVDHR